MSHPRHTTDRTDTLDALLGTAGVAWILGFVAAIESALGKLFY
ncbi:hypothetical protein ACFQS7_27415 [Dankookia sp. GCM10030260]